MTRSPRRTVGCAIERSAGMKASEWHWYEKTTVEQSVNSDSRRGGGSAPPTYGSEGATPSRRSLEAASKQSTTRQKR